MIYCMYLCKSCGNHGNMYVPVREWSSFDSSESERVLKHRRGVCLFPPSCGSVFTSFCHSHAVTNNAGKLCLCELSVTTKCIVR